MHRDLTAVTLDRDGGYMQLRQPLGASVIFASPALPGRHRALVALRRRARPARRRVDAVELIGSAVMYRLRASRRTPGRLCHRWGCRPGSRAALTCVPVKSNQPLWLRAGNDRSASPVEAGDGCRVVHHGCLIVSPAIQVRRLPADSCSPGACGGSQHGKDMSNGGHHSTSRPDRRTLGMAAACPVPRNGQHMVLPPRGRTRPAEGAT